MSFVLLRLTAVEDYLAVAGRIIAESDLIHSLYPLCRSAGEVWCDEVDRVFTREDGAGLDPEAVSVAFRKLCAAAEVRTIRLHDIRHSHATLMLAGGVPIEVISKRLGHSRTSTTMDLYVHPDDAQQRAAADVFGRLEAGGGEG